MSGFDIVLLILSVVIIAALIGMFMNYGQPSLGDFTEDLDQDLQDKPKQKEYKPKAPSRQLTESAQELVKEINKVAKTPTTQEESQQLAKDIVEAVTTTPKKKRKYYPKKKKA